MRRTARRLIIATILMSLPTCGGLSTIKIKQESSSVIQKGTLLEQLAGDMGFGEFLNMDISQSTELQNQGVEKHQINEVFLNRLDLQITDPATGQDFTFLDSIAFYVEADGEPKVRIASASGFAADQTLIEMELDPVDLAPYAVAPSMDITTEVTGRRPDNDTTVLGTIGLTVNVNVGGLICGPGPEGADGGA